MPPMEVFRIQAIAAPCPLFIALLSAVDCGLKVGFNPELDRLNSVWQRVWKDTTGVDVDEAARKLNEPKQS